MQSPEALPARGCWPRFADPVMERAFRRYHRVAGRPIRWLLVPVGLLLVLFALVPQPDLSGAVRAAALLGMLVVLFVPPWPLPLRLGSAGLLLLAWWTLPSWMLPPAALTAGDLLLVGLLGLLAGREDYASRLHFARYHAAIRRTGRARRRSSVRVQWLENMARVLRHELRNALLGVSSSLRLLREKAAAGGGEAYLQRASQSAFHMKRLLDDSAEAAALEASLAHDQPEMIDLGAWLVDRVEFYRQQYSAGLFHLGPVDSVRIAATEERLAQLLDKLVNNAVEHSPVDGNITLRLERQGNTAVLQVANRGDALPADKESIFALFASGKPAGGSNIGLGLYIVRLIVQAYGGSVRALDLHDPPGACFEVRWPAGFLAAGNPAGRAQSSQR